MENDLIPVIYLVLPILVIWFIVDLIRKKRGWFQRILQIIFGYYLLHVADLTLGEIALPAQEKGLLVQLIPFQFLGDIFSYEIGSFYFYNAMKLSFYNLLLLVPLGVFLFLFGWRKGRTVFLIVFLTSLTIEVVQLLLSATGFIWPRIFDVDDLILNTAGGIIGFYVMKGIFHFIKRFLKKR